MGVFNYPRFVTSLCFFLTILLIYLHYFSFDQRFSWYFILCPMYILDFLTFISAIMAVRIYFNMSTSYPDIVDVDCLIGTALVYIPKTTVEILLGWFLSYHHTSNIWVIIGPFILLLLISTISCVFQFKHHRSLVFESLYFTLGFFVICLVLWYHIPSFPMILVYLSILPGGIVTSVVMFKSNCRTDSIVHLVVTVISTILICVFYVSYFDPTNSFEITSLKVLLGVLMVYCVYHLFLAFDGRNTNEWWYSWLFNKKKVPNKNKSVSLYNPQVELNI
eukprot:TRINITY_DN1377_c0_g1_i1.p1 TRINITY_DN1377_c0_g1~~TRINITY_DN1377_c0_g1_i1.p1  ORF type:complete len:277 (+),score=37.35 TRINITY_DN1377_c0_g1_i1:100-930(+)